MAQVWEATPYGPAYRCSGSVVGPIKVLTAARCFRSGVPYGIRIGHVNTHRDLAVASLEADPSSVPEVYHLTVNTYVEPAPGQYATVQGWGRTCLTCTGSQFLKEARVRIIDQG
ncbi:hypothetical protein [Streptomyces sp. enrichment culture]|uniref:hypothetical protein n=1 Tax=Streptomyces sp. enrichment culture TaxID=1795815 RepID=UPI003F54BC1D